MIKVGQVIKFKSKVIREVERNAHNRITITFVSGAVRPYKDISDNKLRSLVVAISAGNFFNHAIRNNPLHQVA